MTDTREWSWHDAAIQRYVSEIRRFLPSLSSEQRVELFSSITEGYCVHCGDPCTSICHCMNDE